MGRFNVCEPAPDLGSGSYHMPYTLQLTPFVLDPSPRQVAAGPDRARWVAHLRWLMARDKTRAPSAMFCS